MIDSVDNHVADVVVQGLVEEVVGVLQAARAAATWQ